jgi:hypothetical protein
VDQDIEQEEAEMTDEDQHPSPMEEREERQHAQQQHGDTFAVEPDETEEDGDAPNDDEESEARGQRQGVEIDEDGAASIARDEP